MDGKLCMLVEPCFGLVVTATMSPWIVYTEIIWLCMTLIGVVPGILHKTNKITVIPLNQLLKEQDIIFANGND